VAFTLAPPVGKGPCILALLRFGWQPMILAAFCWPAPCWPTVRDCATDRTGGEQQMLAVARPLITNPRLLILDEATEGLAPLIRAEIWAVFERLKRDGLSILLIDKNLSHIKRVADRHYILEKGRVVWQGTSRDLMDLHDAVHRYLSV
jgi:ABC-type branched-subunit amino acid transport system ATPase component